MQPLSKLNFAPQVDFQQHNYLIVPLAYNLSTFPSQKWQLFDIENHDKKEIIKDCLRILRF